jgi:hypothetical protein
MINYDTYHQYVKSIANDLSNFKIHPGYTDVLEHVSFQQGQEYLKYISKFNLTDEQIYDFCKKNDSLGNPIKYHYPFGYVSPSSLRYILHSLLILEHIKNLNINNIKIVEVGGGYGGLCLAINHFSKLYNITFDYTIIDLEYVSKLQSNYLAQHFVSVKCIEPYGESLEGEYFLISNYCFSEIDKDSQNKYISLLFPKVKHGFIIWNMMEDPYYFGFKCDILEEYPQTGIKNKYVYF